MSLPERKMFVVVLTSNITFNVTLPEIILKHFLEEHSLIPIFICPAEGSLTRFLRDNNIRVTAIPQINRWRRLAVRLTAPFTLRKIRRIAFGHNVVLVHAARLSVTPFAVKLAKQLQVPCLSHLHGVPPSSGKFRRYLAHKADVLVAVSQGALEQYRPLGENKAVVVFNGMNVAEFRRRADQLDVRSNLGLGDHMLVGIAGINLRKGIDIFVEAAGKVAKAVSQARFLILGGPLEGEAGKMLRVMIEDAGIADKVYLLGFQENVAPFMAAADLWLVPSRDDAAPMVVMEAMSLGKPVVGSNVGGIPELIQHGLTGFVLPSGNADAFAEAILELLADHTKCNDFGVASGNWADAHFTYAKYGESMWQVYSRLLQK